ncbi:hypothetical protein [Streptomyces olivaceus]|uniref:hypothetical protein n=1 Tax=Streptomyces olivaceus TaxID=47716 RepID=UPI0036EDCC3D
MHDPIPAFEWQKFLTDSEEAIRATAPVEATARERTARPLEETHTGERPVGELWQNDTSAEPPWRQLDTHGKLRRTGRVIAAAATLVLLLTLFSCLPDAPPELPRPRAPWAPVTGETASITGEAEESPGADAM